MIKTETAGGIVLNSKGEVLMVSQRNNVWSLPKGHIDPGETALEAAVREIYEESGIKNVKLIKKLGVYDRYKISRDGPDDKDELKTIHIFLFTTDEESLQPIDPDNPEAKWIKKGDVTKILFHDKDKQFFESVMNEF